MDELENIKLKCRNFKCFGDEPQGFDEIKPINIIIGRNNSGKSTLLDLVEFAISPSEQILGRGHKGQIPQILMARKLTDDVADELPSDQVVMKNQDDFQRLGLVPRSFAKRELRDKWFECEITVGGPYIFTRVFPHSEDKEYARENIQWIGGFLASKWQKLLNTYRFHRIAADRDVSRERTSGGGALSIDRNGSRCTSIIERYLHFEKLNPALIQEILRNDLNAILQPDANYRQIVARQDDGEHWEIWIDEPGKGLIRLSETGSGLKTILLVW